MATTPAEWLAAYREAWLRRDADAAAALFTADATYAEQPYQDPFVGSTGVRDYWARVTATQSNIDMKYGTPITVGNRTAVEWWTTLANDGVPITLAGAAVAGGQGRLTTVVEARVKVCCRCVAPVRPA